VPIVKIALDEPVASAMIPDNKTGIIDIPPVREVKIPYTLPLKFSSVSSCNIVAEGTFMKEFDIHTISSKTATG